MDVLLKRLSRRPSGLLTISLWGSARCVSLIFRSGKRLTIQQNEYVDNIDEELVKPTDKRIFAIANAFGRGYTIEQIHRMTNIDHWFLKRLFYIHQMEKDLS